MPAKRGLYANIHAKKKRIAAGSGEKMRKAGAKGAPKQNAFKAAAKTKKPAAKQKTAKQKAQTKAKAMAKAAFNKQRSPY
jgi:hypothetical protein